MSSGYGAATTSSAEAPLAPREDVHLLSYAFNQANSHFICGTTAGFRTFKLQPLAEVRREERNNRQLQNVVVVSMLFQTRHVALVSEDRGLQKVYIWDMAANKQVSELHHRTEVKGVLMSATMIATICEYTSYLHSLQDLKCIMTLETCSNPRGLGALLPEGSPWIFIRPTNPKGHIGVQVGEKQVSWDKASYSFKAHETSIVALALSNQGQCLATASETGTVVKVFKTCDGQLLYRLRRGSSSQNICCVVFASTTHPLRSTEQASFLRNNVDYVAVASSSRTVHIFKLDPEVAASEERAMEGTPPQPHSSALLAADEEAARDAGGGDSVDSRQAEGGILRQAVTTVASGAASIGSIASNVVPTMLSDMRSFAVFRLPDLDTGVDTRSEEARIHGAMLAFHGTEPKLFVLCYSGVLYECSFNPDHDPSRGTQECGFLGATPWFAVRPDFQVQGDATIVTASGDDDEDDLDAEEWQLLK
eukprot:TRINITY_DN80528_c0_g1_i1.p1 TRINITY_DN80528_c0_g1~~TRINITY_DN80528_c0_g1_i1.p1  ORF type:complete len:478 (-),score=110.14 TRINITY_DN80528_c0_g1_i1:126-1559(-)